MRRSIHRHLARHAVALAALGAALAMGGGCASPTRAADPPPAAGDSVLAASPRAGEGDAAGAGAPDTISRSAGSTGGVIILWPRVIPRSDDPVLAAAAGALQERLVQAAKRNFPGRPVDVRPAPERNCPQRGCDALAVGAVLLHAQGGGCAAAMTVAMPGRSPMSITPWVGQVDLKSPTVEFRGTPESELKVKDFERCEKLARGEATVSDFGIDEALRTASHQLDSP